MEPVLSKQATHEEFKETSKEKRVHHLEDVAIQTIQSTSHEASSSSKKIRATAAEQLTAVGGKYEFPDGGYFEGPIERGLPNGFGKWHAKNNKSYREGNFVDGLLEGEGKRFDDAGKLIFEGLYKESDAYFGKEYLDDGEMYEGEFKNRDWEGKGKSYMNGVLIYEGEYHKGERHGFGKLYSLLGVLEYQGDFKNGVPDGIGILYKNSIPIYNGGVKTDDQGIVWYHGYGKYTYPIGEVYEGEWVWGARHGKGTLKGPWGEFTGFWNNGSPNWGPLKERLG